MPNTDLLVDTLERRIVIIDGAMGTMIQAHKLVEADYRGKEFAGHPRDLHLCNDVLNITQPAIIEKIHRQYLEAGADIIETNTFNSTAISMAEYGLQGFVYDLNKAGAQAARRAVDGFARQNPERSCWVAGSLGPTSRTASASQDISSPAARAVTFDQLRDAYYEQIRGLVDGGVDLLLVETIFDTLNGKAALFAAQQYFENTGKRLPLAASVTIVDLSGRTLSGQTVEAFWISVSQAPLVSVGINCALGAHLHKLLSERRPAQRFRRIRRNSREYVGRLARVCVERLGEHRGRLLRVNARAHSRHPRSSQQDPAPRAAPGRALFALQRARAPGNSPRDQFCEYWRAHQRDRLAEILEAHSGRPIRRGPERRQAAG